MSGKTENDILNAGALLAEMFAGDNASVQKAVQNVRAKTGHNPHGDEPIDDSNVVDVECEIIEETRDVPRSSRPSNTSQASSIHSASHGAIYYCVFSRNGKYMGRAYPSPHQAFQFSESEPGSFVRKLTAEKIPVG